MILRRITEHVKAQNWFAVAIDFVIVVVGVGGVARGIGGLNLRSAIGPTAIDALSL